MKKKRFCEAQIVAILKEGKAGMTVHDLSRKYGFGECKYCQSVVSRFRIQDLTLSLSGQE